MTAIEALAESCEAFNRMHKVCIDKEHEINSLRLSLELRERELGISQNKAIAFIMPDDDDNCLIFPTLIYDDISIII